MIFSIENESNELVICVNKTLNSKSELDLYRVKKLLNLNLAFSAHCVCNFPANSNLTEAQTARMKSGIPKFGRAFGARLGVDRRVTSAAPESARLSGFPLSLSFPANLATVITVLVSSRPLPYLLPSPWEWYSNQAASTFPP